MRNFDPGSHKSFARQGQEFWSRFRANSSSSHRGLHGRRRDDRLGFRKRNRAGVSTIYVDRLQIGVTADEIHEIFKVFGRIQEIHIAKKRRRHTNYNFGFVKFLQVEDALEAWNRTKGLPVKGVKIFVDWAKFDWKSSKATPRWRRVNQVWRPIRKGTDNLNPCDKELSGKEPSILNKNCPEVKQIKSIEGKAVKFIRCNETTLSGIQFINSSQTHVTLVGCNVFRIDGLTIEAPGNSPNTDGIHLQHAHNIIITNTGIGTGDDCVSIGDYTSNIDILNVTCGPGHGISIGSLGRGGNYVQVKNILVRNVYFKGTTNGARIKTWREGRGYVQRVIFENLFFNSVKNPLIIDQNYGASIKEEMGVWISDVTYKHLYGTTSSKVAINLNCSRSVACTDVTLDSIMFWPTPLLGKQLTSYCSNSFGIALGVVQPPSCLSQQTSTMANTILDLLMN